MTPLRERMIGDMRLRNLAETTVDCYARAVRMYAEFFGRSPDKLDREHVRKYLLYLREEKKLSQGSCNQAVAALRFFYGVTLGTPTAIEDVCFTKEDKKRRTKLTEIRLWFLRWTPKTGQADKV